MEAENVEGLRLRIDGSESSGGVGGGFRPMQLLLAGIGGCSIIDIIGILRKQKQDLNNVEIVVNGERDQTKTPSVFKDIHLHYRLSGRLDQKKVERAIDLGLKKYCSVGEMLGKSATISYDYEIVDQRGE